MNTLLKKIKKLLVAFYRLSRIKTIVFDYFWLLTVLGILASGFNLRLIDYIIAIIVTLSVHCYSFIVNDCEDAEDDAMDEKKAKRNPISAKYITYKQGIIILQFTSFPAVILSFLFQGISPALITISALIAGHLYSWRKLRFKSMPFIDIVSHSYALAGFNILYYMVLPGTNTSIGSIFIFTASLIFSMAGALYNQLRDYDVDVKSNLRNTTITFGFENSKKISLVLYALGVILGIIGIVERLNQI